MLDPADLNHLQSAHNGDIDVHNHNIRQKGINPRQGLHAIGGFPHHLAVVGLPVKEPLKALPDHNFVVNQQHPQFFHLSPSSLWMGSSSLAVVPPKSFFR